jgi:hypothetical protein
MSLSESTPSTLLDTTPDSRFALDQDLIRQRMERRSAERAAKQQRLSSHVGRATLDLLRAESRIFGKQVISDEPNISTADLPDMNQIFFDDDENYATPFQGPRYDQASGTFHEYEPPARLNNEGHQVIDADFSVVKTEVTGPMSGNNSAHAA